jgi:hypothetical protein
VATQWISVEEKLPKVWEPVVATKEPKGYRHWPFYAAIMDKDGYWQNSEAEDIEVTHWTPVDITFSEN